MHSFSLLNVDGLFICRENKAKKKGVGRLFYKMFFFAGIQ
jgi:hypothetical protein